MHETGQLLTIGLKGTALSDEEKDFIEDENIGGVLLLKHNFESPAQLAELCNSIQTLRREFPLFISVDHEGGRVHRFGDQFTHFPPMLDVCKLDSPKTCFEVSQIMAEELAAVGINLNYAPVCDILLDPENKVIGDRAYGTTSDHVSKFVSSVIRGLQTKGVLACAKHFPGHGSTNKDSHHTLPIVKKPFDKVKQEDMVPFVKAAKSRVESFMMAHLIFEEIDPDLPCSLSPKAYHILRNDLRFNKVIFTDDMMMNAIVDHHTAEKAGVMALKAGADNLIYREFDVAKSVLEEIKKAQRDGELKSDQILEKFERVMDCKKRNLKEYKPVYIPEIPKKVKTKSHTIFLEDLQKKIAAL